MSRTDETPDNATSTRAAPRARIKQRTLQQRRQENLRTPHPAAQRREVSLAERPLWSTLI